MALVVKERKNAGYFNSYIFQRIEQNKNFLACVTGQTGSGKSWSALRQGEVLDPNFDIGNVCFTAKEFMDLVNQKVKVLKSGSVIVYDEIQVSMSHLDYQAIQSKLINYVLQTFRHKNFILFFTSPHFSFINKSARKLFHCRMETMSINPSEKTCTLKPFLLQTNQESGKTYRKYLRVWIKDRGVVPLKTLKISEPSKELIKAYEDKKSDFTKTLNESIARDLEKLEGKDKSKKELTTQQDKIVAMLKAGKLIKDVALALKVNPRLIYTQIKYIKKKDIKITPIRVENRVQRYEIVGY